MLRIKDDEHFEGFCEALEVTKQNRVVQDCFQRHRVRDYHLSLIIDYHLSLRYYFSDLDVFMLCYCVIVLTCNIHCVYCMKGTRNTTIKYLPVTLTMKKLLIMLTAPN